MTQVREAECTQRVRPCDVVMGEQAVEDGSAIPLRSFAAHLTAALGIAPSLVEDGDQVEKILKNKNLIRA